jgi:2,3-bisphosphoglycerate-independent phosphoglycerate mutase
VGHMTIGSGRIIYQSMARINKSIESGDFYGIPEFAGAIENCKKNNSRLHLMGLLQSEGVHAHEDHLIALLELCRRSDFTDVGVHVITDGRDAPVTDSLKHLEKLGNAMRDKGVGEIETVSGRYYAMDRNRAWDRTKKAYDCIVSGVTERVFDDAGDYIRGCHGEGETDEFITPGRRGDYDGIKDGDSIIFFNFRTDRTRQLTQAIVEGDFTGFERAPPRVHYVAMTQYYRPMNALVAFKDQKLGNLLGQAVSNARFKQLRISETEKYAHVTFFFNGQVEKPYVGEDRILIESPKIATYDLKPRMSVYEITESLCREIAKGEYDLIVANLVNCDMVGHTGVVEAVKEAVTAVDDCVGKIVECGLENDYTLLIFADHGNAEDQTGLWRTSHTTNPVPLILVAGDDMLRNARLRGDGGLRDVAPTALALLGLQKPEEMTGDSIIA